MIEAVDLEQMLKWVPMSRTGRAEEVAAVVSFLMSDEASYITRQVIGVNGGLV
jgi:3-oxoacyl-[acyl-carrier protein] reductase